MTKEIWRLIMRINNLEILFHEINRDPEIVSYFKNNDGTESKYTILWYVKDSEGYSINFVGDRPFTCEDIDGVLWDLMLYGQTVLNARFKLESNLK